MLWIVSEIGIQTLIIHENTLRSWDECMRWTKVHQAFFTIDVTRLELRLVL